MLEMERDGWGKWRGMSGGKGGMGGGKGEGWVVGK